MEILGSSGAIVLSILIESAMYLLHFLETISYIGNIILHIYTYGIVSMPIWAIGRVNGQQDKSPNGCRRSHVRVTVRAITTACLYFWHSRECHSAGNDKTSSTLQFRGCLEIYFAHLACCDTPTSPTYPSSTTTDP